jgi:hypothetical protein
MKSGIIPGLSLFNGLIFILMNLRRKQLLWLVVFVTCFFAVHAQNNQWILGEWKGIGVIPGSAYGTVFVRILRINIEHNNRFSGVLVQELMDNKSIRIEKEISGTILNDEINIKAGRTLYKKQPLHGVWADCSACKFSSTRVTVSSDSLMLTSETRLCGNYCDGYTTYYKALSGFDTATQKQLVQLFGSPLLVKIFKPVLPAITYEHESTKTGQQINKTSTETTQQQLGRTNKTVATYTVQAPDIKLELFDNGEIDGDTVTVYHNKQIIIDRQVLGVQPIPFVVKANAANRVHEFILVANNLGRVPPNTALLRITAGSRVYELFASTTLSQNASVIIIYGGE